MATTINAGTVTLNTGKAVGNINTLNKSLNNVQQPLGKINSNFKEFEKSLDAATARVVAFTATTGLIYGIGDAISRLTRDAIEVEAAMTKVQAILKVSDNELKNLTGSLFTIANSTGQTFGEAAKALEEFARQGLNTEKTLKATEAALIVARLSGANLEDTINGLVATVSSFSNELLDYGRVANTLVGIDAKFSTSAAGLIEGIKRVGSVASDAGVTFEELSSAIAAVRQVTGRSESVIGNGLKTIFTNLQTDKVRNELAKLGIQTQSATGEFLPLISVVDQLAGAFQKLNDAQRADLGQKIAGKYQINTFKALIQSFGGADTSLFDQAMNTARMSQDEAIKRNELLNQTTAATLTKLNNTITELGASFGNKITKPLIDSFATLATTGINVLTDVFKDNPIGDFLSGGIISALKGPGLALAIIAVGKLTKRIAFELSDAIKSVSGLNQKEKDNLIINNAILQALKNENDQRVRAVLLASTLEDKQRAINALLKSSYPSASNTISPAVQLVDPKVRKQVLSSPGAAKLASGYIPTSTRSAMMDEMASIQNGVGGARKTAKAVPARINMAGGSTPVVVNTDEHIIRNFQNSGQDAVFNRQMTQRVGGVSNLKKFGKVEKVMANGYVPNFANRKLLSENPFVPTSGKTFGLDPAKIDFIRKITENITGIRTNPIRFRKLLGDNAGEFWANSNNVFLNTDVIKSPGKRNQFTDPMITAAHEYGHFIEHNADPELMNAFYGAYQKDRKKKGSLFYELTKKIGYSSADTYTKKQYFSESFADTFGYSFLDAPARNYALGGRSMSEMMFELIGKNIPRKGNRNFADGFTPDMSVDDMIRMLTMDINIDEPKNISRSIRRGIDKKSFLRFAIDKKKRNIEIEDIESYKKGDAFKNFKELSSFAKKRKFTISSPALIKQAARDKTGISGMDLLYSLFPQLRYRDGITRKTSGQYSLNRKNYNFKNLDDLKNQIGRLSDDDIRKIAVFRDINDSFAQGLIPNFAKKSSNTKNELRGKSRIGKVITPQTINKRFKFHYERGKDYESFYSIVNEEGKKAGLSDTDLSVFAGITSAISPRSPDYLAAQAAPVIFNHYLKTRSKNPKDYLDLEFETMLSKDDILDKSREFKKQGIDPKTIDFSQLKKKRTVQSLGHFGPKGAKNIGLAKALSGQQLGANWTSKTRQYQGGILGNLDAFPIDTNVQQAILPELGKKDEKGGTVFSLTKREEAEVILLARKFAKANKLPYGAAGLQAAIFKSNSKFKDKYTPEFARQTFSKIDRNFANGYIPNFADINNSTRKIAEKSNSELLLTPNGELKVGHLRSEKGNPLFEIARLIKNREIKKISAGDVIGPRVPDLIVGLQKILERERTKDPSYPRIPITGYLDPRRITDYVNYNSEKKTKARSANFELEKSQGIVAGKDYFTKKDQKKLISAYRKLGVSREQEEVNLKTIFPQGLANGYIPNFADIPDMSSIVSELDRLSPSQRLKFAKTNFPKLGKGSSRIVYDIGGAALKLPLNEAGIAQNAVESDPYRFSDESQLVLPKIFERGGADEFLIAQLAEKYNAKDFKKITGTSINALSSDLLNYQLRIGRPNVGKKARSRINYDNPYVKGFKSLVDEGLLAGDFRGANVGFVTEPDVDSFFPDLISRKRPVLLDYGYDENVRNNFYRTRNFGKKFADGYIPNFNENIIDNFADGFLPKRQRKAARKIARGIKKNPLYMDLTNRPSNRDKLLEKFNKKIFLRRELASLLSWIKSSKNFNINNPTNNDLKFLNSYFEREGHFNFVPHISDKISGALGYVEELEEQDLDLGLNYGDPYMKKSLTQQFLGENAKSFEDWDKVDQQIDELTRISSIVKKSKSMSIKELKIAQIEAEKKSDKLSKLAYTKVLREKVKRTETPDISERLDEFKSKTFLQKKGNRNITKLIYDSIKNKRKGSLAPQDPRGAQLALGNQTVKNKLGFDPESLYGFASDIDSAKYFFRGSSVESFAIQRQLGQFTSSGFANSDRVLGTNVSSSLLKAIGYAMSTGGNDDRAGLVGIYNANKTRKSSRSVPSPYPNEADNTLKFSSLAEENLIAYFDPVSGRVLPKNNSLVSNYKIDPYKLEYTKKLLDDENALSQALKNTDNTKDRDLLLSSAWNVFNRRYENSNKFKSDDKIDLYRTVGLNRSGTTLSGLNAPSIPFDIKNQSVPSDVDKFIAMLTEHTMSVQPGFISFGQESSKYFDLRSFRPISREERKKIGASKDLARDQDYARTNLIYKKQIKSNDLVDRKTLEELRSKSPKEVQEFFSQDRIYDLDSILGKNRSYSEEREFTAFTTKPKFNIGRLIAKSAADGYIPNFNKPSKSILGAFKNLNRLRKEAGIKSKKATGFTAKWSPQDKEILLRKPTSTSSEDKMIEVLSLYAHEFAHTSQFNTGEDKMKLGDRMSPMISQMYQQMVGKSKNPEDLKKFHRAVLLKREQDAWYYGEQFIPDSIKDKYKAQAKKYYATYDKDFDLYPDKAMGYIPNFSSPLSRYKNLSEIRKEYKAYKAAAESGDERKMSKIIENIRQKSGYTSEKLYHGTYADDPNFRVFDPTRGNQEGFHFGTKEAAMDRLDSFARKVGSSKESRIREFYLKGDIVDIEDASDNTAYATAQQLFDQGKLKQSALTNISNATNKRILNASSYSNTSDSDLEDIVSKSLEAIRKREAKIGRELQSPEKELISAIGDKIFRYTNNYEDAGNPSFVTYSESAIKLANNKTYDKRGRLIPPFRRYDSRNPDINYANGYIPNFADGLKDSVNREVDALVGMGYPKSLAMGSVKVGTSERLKNKNNPNGLGVYNLAQGQMTLGQAIGQHSNESQSKKFVPNFANLKQRRQDIARKYIEDEISKLKFDGLDDKITEILSNKISKLLPQAEIDKYQKDYLNKQKDAFDKLKSQTSIFSSEKKIVNKAEQLGISTGSNKFLDMKSGIEAKRGRILSAASFGLPFAVGGISSALGGDQTKGGRIATSVGEAAGTVALGAQFGTLGLIVSSVVGGLQLLTSVAKELRPNLEELSKKSQEVAAANEKEISSLQQFTQASSQLKSLIEGGASPMALSQAKTALSQASAGITGPYREKIITAGTEDERSQIIQEATLQAQRKQAGADTQTIIAATIEKEFSNIYDSLGQIAPGDNRKSLNAGNVSTIARELVKSVDIPNLSGETTKKLATSTATLKDLGLKDDLFKDIDKFFVTSGQKASDAILKFAQTIILSQKSTEDLIKSQVDAAAAFGQSKQAFLNLLQNTFVGNQITSSETRGRVESGLNTARNILQSNENLLSPEAILSGREQIQRAEINSQTANERQAVGNELSQKIISDVLAKGSNISLEKQTKIQDIIGTNISSEGGFDPVKLANEVQNVLDPDAAKSLQSELLKTNIEMAQKLNDIDIKSNIANQQLNEQTAIAQKQLSDSRLVNLLGGFKSDFKSVLKSIKAPQGGFTVTSPVDGSQRSTFGQSANLGGVKEGTEEGAVAAQKLLETAQNRVEFIKSLNLPEQERKPILDRLQGQIKVARESQLVSQTAMLGQQEVVDPLKQFKDLTSNSFAKGEIDKQIKVIEQTLKQGEVPIIPQQFIDLLKNNVPQNGQKASQGNDLLNQFLEGKTMVESVAKSRTAAAEKTAEEIVGDKALPPEFKQQIDSINNNTNQLLTNTTALNSLSEVLKNLPEKLKNLQELTKAQQLDATLKKGLTDQQSSLASEYTKLEAVQQRSIVEKVVRSGADSQYRPFIRGGNLTSSGLAGNVRDKNKVEVAGVPDYESFFKFIDQSKSKPTTGSGLEGSLREYFSSLDPNFTQQYYKQTPDELFKKTLEGSTFKDLKTQLDQNPSLFLNPTNASSDIQKRIDSLEKDVKDTQTKINENNARAESVPAVSNNTSVNAPIEINIASNGPLDQNQLKSTVMQAITDVFKESNVPLPMQRPTSNTAVA